MACARSALVCLAALALLAPPCAAGDDAATSLLQVKAGVRVAGGMTSQKRSSAALQGTRRGQWPNPADPKMKANIAQKFMMANLKKHPHNMALVNMSVSSIALTPVSYVAEHGGYDILFGALHDFANESTVQMNAWRGLSDQSHTEVGSNFIANYGGPNRGIEYMVEQLKAHPTAYEADCIDHLTYQYEVLQCISGLLLWDVNGTRGRAAVSAGLLEATVHALEVEHDRRATMDVACNTLGSLLFRNPSYAKQLRKLGAEKLILRAISRYHAYDPTPFWFGTTYGLAYPVIPGCLSAIVPMFASHLG